MSREVSVFHWASDSLTGNEESEPVALTSWNAYKYAVGREYMFHTGPFLNSRVPGQDTGTMAGRGLYAASDPNATRQYGNTLFEIRIPEGSRFLDLREGGSDGRILVTKDTYDKMIAEGCDLTSSENPEPDPSRGTDMARGVIESTCETEPGETRSSRCNALLGRGAASETVSPRNDTYILRSDNGYYASISKTLFEQNRAYNEIFSDAISELDVNFLAYSYNSSPSSFCDTANNNNPSAAFVMIDNRMRGNVRNYNKAQIDAAIERSEETGRPLPEDIRRILQLNTALYSTDDPQYREQTDSDTINFWKSRMFNCDRTFEEDQVDSGLQGHY